MGSQKRLLKLHVAALRADVVRLEMRSETERIFLFVTVTFALMELSDYSAMKCHGFITRKEFPTACKMLSPQTFWRGKLLRRNDLVTIFHVVSHYCKISCCIRYVIHLNRLNIKACRGNTFNSPAIGFLSQ